MKEKPFITVQQNSHTVIFIPSTECLVTRITLPQLKNIHTHNAFLYALEHTLCEEIEHLDLAILNHNVKTQETIVAVYKKSLFTSRLKKSVGTTKILPDYFALPYYDNTWTVLHQPDKTLVRTGLFEGFAIEKNNFDLYREAALEKPGNINTLPADTDFITLAQSQLAKLPNINLLRNTTGTAYSPLIPTTSLKKWRWPILLFFSWVVILGITDISKYFYLTQIANTLSAELSVKLTRLYPQAKSNEDLEARLQHDMTSSLKQNNHFWNDLGIISSLLQEQTTVTLTAIRYNNGQFDLLLSAPHSTALEQFDTRLAKAHVKILSHQVTSENQKSSERLSVSVRINS